MGVPVQDRAGIASAVKGLAIVLPALAILLFALAVYLARGWRRRTLRTTGWGSVLIGAALLLIRRLAGDAVVDGLVKEPSNEPAMHQVWNIATSLLLAIAVAIATERGPSCSAALTRQPPSMSSVSGMRTMTAASIAIANVRGGADSGARRRCAISCPRT
jgi:hypothetical protein